eukprot:scaffold2843_cov90-Isochrysis_galbana.AAC.4
MAKCDRPLLKSRNSCATGVSNQAVTTSRAQYLSIWESGTAFSGSTRMRSLADKSPTTSVLRHVSGHSETVSRSGWLLALAPGGGGESGREADWDWARLGAAGVLPQAPAPTR